MNSWRKLLRVLLVCGMMPLTAWSSFPLVACACPSSVEMAACNCSCCEHGEVENSRCQKACCRMHGSANAIVQQQEPEPIWRSALIEESLALPVAQVCQCNSVPGPQPADSATRQADRELSVLHLALPDVILVRELEQHGPVRFLDATLPRLDRVILFCSLLI